MKLVEIAYLDHKVSAFKKNKNIYQHFKCKHFWLFRFSWKSRWSGNWSVNVWSWRAPALLCFPLSSSLLPPACFSSSYLLPVSCKHLSLHPLPLPELNPLIFTFLFMAHLFLQFKLKYSFSHLYSSQPFPLVPSPSVTVSACP